MVPLRSDRHLVSGRLVGELTHLGAAETLRAAVSDAVLAVQTEQTVVAAGAVVAAGVEAPGVVRWRVLQAGRQSQVLLVCQAALTARLAGQPAGPRARLAAVLTLGQHRQQLRVDQ